MGTFRGRRRIGVHSYSVPFLLISSGNSRNKGVDFCAKCFYLLKWDVEKKVQQYMQTKYWDVMDQQLNNSQEIEAAAAFLQQGSTIAFPTETVYGLGADATSEEAVAKIFKAKGRPQDNPLIVHVATKDQLTKLVTDLPDYAEQLITAFTPGPITFVLPSNGVCAANVTAGLSTVAVRIPDHPVAKQLLTSCKLPIAAPSANISGKPSPTTAHHVWDDLSGKISGILNGGQTGVGVESTVVDCTGDVPVILRPGGITKEQIIQVVGQVTEDPALESSKEKPISPGLKYKHYSPEVPLILVEGSAESVQETIDHEQSKSLRIGVLARTPLANQVRAEKVIPLGDDLSEVAMRLYDGLRSFHTDEVDLIICESFPEKDIGQAIMNRLRKAAETDL